MFALLDVIAQHSHLLAIIDVRHVPALCQLTVSHGNVYANDCVSVS